MPSIAYEQLYAQLKHEILVGERYWFSEEEEAEIQENNQTFYRTTPLEELFHRVYREVDAKTEAHLQNPVFIQKSWIDGIGRSSHQ
jgi:hypothetical protein